MPRRKIHDLKLVDALARELGYRRASRKIQTRTLTFLQYLRQRYKKR